MKKSETIFVCQSCSYQSGKWLGKCPECGEWNSLVEERARKSAGRNGFALRDVKAVAFNEIEPQDDMRVSSGVTEFDRVLGGGVIERAAGMRTCEPASMPSANFPRSGRSGCSAGVA